MEVRHAFLPVQRNTNQMAMVCLLSLPGRAHDKGHALHDPTRGSGGQAPYP